MVRCISRNSSSGRMTVDKSRAKRIQLSGPVISAADLYTDLYTDLYAPRRDYLTDELHNSFEIIRDGQYSLGCQYCPLGSTKDGLHIVFRYANF